MQNGISTITPSQHSSQKPSKHKNIKTTIDDIRFDSKVEGQYYEYLKTQKEEGLISDFELQPRFLLQEGYTNHEGKKIRPIYYVGDFLVTYLDGSQVVIDIKGQPTSEAKLKRKLYEYRYTIPLQWIVYVKKRGGWLLYEENERLKKLEKGGR